MCLAVLPVLGPARWDQVLAEFLEHLYDTDQSKELGKQVLSALLWIQPDIAGPLRRCFPVASQSLRGWARLHPGRSKAPLPRAVAAGMAAYLVKTGRLTLGLAVMTMFETYVRSGELLAMKAGQVVEGMAGATGALACVSIILHPEELEQPSKTGEWDSSIAFDLPRHKWLGELLLQRARAMPTAAPLWDFEYTTLLQVMREAAQAVGAGILDPTPHSCRHGGASHDFATDARRLPEIQARGKWRAMTSVRRYEKHARIAVQWGLLAPSVQQRLLASEEGLYTAFAGAWPKSSRGAGGRTDTSSWNFSPAVAGSVTSSADEGTECSVLTSRTLTASTFQIGESTASCAAGSSQAKSGGSGVARLAAPSRKHGALRKAAPSHRP